jgi:hypothetical protein
MLESLTLPPGQRLAVTAIVSGRWAWTRDADLRRRDVSAEDLEQLERSGWLHRWELPKCRAWTLSPWAAAVVERELVERAREPEPEGRDRRRRKAIFWDDIRADRPAERVYPMARTVALEHADWIPDPRPGPDYVADLETGETTQNERGAAKILGAPVLVDRRAAKRTPATKRRKRTKAPSVRKSCR